MDRKTLKQYQALKKEIEDLDENIDKLYDRKARLPTVVGKVKKSSDDFPYIEEHVSVKMNAPKESDAIERLLLIRENRREQAMKTMLDIEQFIADIPNSKDRQIFELAFLKGKKQREIADELGLERSSISKKINGYLQLSHNSQK